MNGHTTLTGCAWMSVSVCVRGVVWDQVILFSLSVVYFFGINWLVIYHLVCMLIE